MAKRVLEVVLVGDSRNLKRTLGQANRELSGFGDKVNRTWAGIGKASRIGGAAVAGAGVAAVKSAIDFESAFAGVRKTVDATEKQYKQLSDGIRRMSREIPVAANEIAGIAEAAGQLGIQRKNILGFTRVMADLGVATNLSGDEAATTLARLANITQMSQGDFDRLGSTIVALGNNLATTESEIAAMGLRIAGAGNQIGLSQAQVLGFAGALSSVGVEAQAGGSSISKTFIKMAAAVQAGGEDLEGFADVAGVSADKFARQFENNAAGATVSFIEGLAKIKAEGGDVFGTLDNLELGELRVRDALLRASGAGDLFRRSLKLGTDAWKDNNALSKEAEQRYKTTSSQLKILGNTFTDIGVTVGSKVLPPLGDLAQKASKALGALMDNKQVLKGLDTGLNEIGRAVTDLKSMIVPAVQAVARVFSDLPTPVKIATGAVVALGLAFAATPVGATIAAIAAGAILIKRNWEPIKGVFDKVKKAVTEWVAKAKGDLNVLASIFTKVATVVRTVLKKAFDIALAVVKRWWAGTRQVLSGVGRVVKGMVDVVMGVLRGDWSRVWNGMKGIVSGAFKAMWGMVRAQTSIARELAARIGRAALRALEGAWDGLKGLASKAFGALVQAIRNKIDATFKAATSIATTVKEVIQKLPGQLLEMGKQMVQGLIDGIRSMFDEVKDAAEDLASLPLKALDKAWVFGSPSRRAKQLGGFIGEGLALGIRGSKARVGSAVKDGLLFPIEQAIAELERQRERLEASWERADTRAERRRLRNDIRDAKRAPLDVTTIDGGTSGGGGGGPSYPLGRAGNIIGTPHAGTHTLGNWQSDNAVDIGVPVGTPVLAVRGGKVVKVGGGYSGGSSRFDGYQVTVQLDDGNSVFYTHLSDAIVKAGDKITGGQRIGTSGAANGVPHLHMGVQRGDPRDLLNAPVGGGGSRRRRRNRRHPADTVAQLAVKDKYTLQELANLWVAAGGDPDMAGLMARIAVAESAGKRTARNPSGASGLWQILGQVVPGNIMDPMVNAKNAVKKFKDAGGTAPWNASKHAWARFVGRPGVSANGDPVTTGEPGSTVDVSSRTDAVKQAKKALAEFEKQQRRNRKLANIDIQVRGLEKMRAWNDALKQIADTLDENVSQAVDAFAEKWEIDVGKAIDRTHAKALQAFDDIQQAALSAFDAETARLVANSPAAQALAAMEAESERIRLAAEDAANLQALEDAKRSGDPRQIKAAQDAMAETARQRQITQLQAQAEQERAAIEAQRAAERTALERQQAEERTALEEGQAAERQRIRDADTEAFRVKLKGDLDAEYRTLVARGQNYANFVNRTNQVLNRLGDGSQGNVFTADASVEAALTAGPAMGVAFAPGSAGWNAAWEQAFRDTHRGITIAEWAAGKRASGGLINKAGVYRVNELGSETLLRAPAGGAQVMNATRTAMARGAGSGGAAVVIQNATIGSMRAAEVLGNKLNYEAAYRP